MGEGGGRRGRIAWQPRTGSLLVQTRQGGDNRGGRRKEEEMRGMIIGRGGEERVGAERAEERGEKDRKEL